MLSAILQSHKYNTKPNININEHIDNPPAFQQYSDTTFNKWQPKIIKYKPVNITNEKIDDYQWDNIKSFPMQNVPDFYDESGYSNIKPIQRTDDLYYQYDLKNYDQNNDIVKKWQRETGELNDMESKMNANIVDNMEFMQEYQKQFKNDMEPESKEPDEIKEKEKKIRVEKATRDNLEKKLPQTLMSYAKSLKRPGQATLEQVKRHNDDPDNNKLPYGVLKSKILSENKDAKIYMKSEQEAKSILTKIR